MTQKEALEILKMGENVFLTGPAGSGKTFLLSKYIKYLKAKKVKIAITASTGIAATHIGGTTIHSFSGIGISKRLNKTELKSLLNKKYLQDRFNKTQVLVIDEISMLDSDRLELINSVCQAFRKNPLPFGGLQVVFCGDFFQLPPVNKKNKKDIYAFLSSAWREANLKVCYLEEQHRQEDSDYNNILNKIRNSDLDDECQQILESRINKPVRGNVTPTKLYTTNRDVSAINEEELAKIDEEQIIFEMEYYFQSGKQNMVEALEKNCLAPAELRLKKGAVVMFVKNKFNEFGKAEYVNGTLAKVTNFTAIDNLPIVETFDGRELIVQAAEWTIEEDEEIIAKISQIPLRLAWAITIHKSQGMSLDEAVIDLGSSFEFNMGYVALSRVRRLEGMCLLGLNKMALEINPEIKKQDKIFQKESVINQTNLKNLNPKEKSELKKIFLLNLALKNEAY